ncbi:hypothetical protein D3C84_1191420 [compost metagenome]
MKLALANLQRENKFLQYVSITELQDEVIARFGTELEKTRKMLGMLAVRAITQHPDTDALWQKIISEFAD